MAEFNEGDSASFAKTITEADILMYAAVSGDFNPVHVNAEFAAQTRRHHDGASLAYFARFHEA